MFSLVAPCESFQSNSPFAEYIDKNLTDDEHYVNVLNKGDDALLALFIS